MSFRTAIRTPALFAVAALLAVAPAAAVKRRAFVTSVSGTGNIPSWPGSSGATALDRADSICRARAAAAALPNATTYRAWLSTPTTDAYCHVQGLSGTKAGSCNGGSQTGGGPWYLVNGITPFTPGLATLAGPDSTIYRGVYFDEFGDPVASAVDGLVWTGTGFDGVASPNTCAGWTSGAGDTLGLAGTARGGSRAWTYWSTGWCDDEKRLLCFEPGASEPNGGSAWLPGSIAFVTSTKGKGNLATWPQAGGAVGIAAGDAICRSAATAAHLPSPDSFVAWLSDVDSDAGDRLTGNGPYRRIDGYAIANSKADLLDGVASNSLHVDETGSYLVLDRGEVFTGTAPDGSASGFDCTNWTSDVSADGTTGYALLARDGTWTSERDNGACYNSHRLLCFSNVVTIFWDGFDLTGDAGRWSSVTP